VRASCGCKYKRTNVAITAARSLLCFISASCPSLSNVPTNSGPSTAGMSCNITANKQHVSKTKKTCVNVMRCGYHRPLITCASKKTQCTCSVLDPFCSLVRDSLGFFPRNFSLSNASPAPVAHSGTRRHVGCSEIHARSRQCTTPPPQSKHPKEPRYNKTGCGYHRDLDTTSIICRGVARMCIHADK
jgi:hypothetical protein